MFLARLGRRPESRKRTSGCRASTSVRNVECAALTSLDDEKLAEKYRHLAERLSRAFTAAPVAGDERHRYMNALLAIAKFFDGLGPFDTYAEKFITLAAALDDLDNGIVRPVLKPKPVENRIPDPIEVQVGRAYVAIAIEALIKAGNKTDEAKLFIPVIHAQLRKSPFDRECVVADAVVVEPVSQVQFPANSENNREF